MFNIEPFVHRQFDNPRSYGSPITDLRVNCPFCVDRVGKMDEQHKLHISLRKEVVHCFRCDYSASWWKFVGAITGLAYIDVFSELYVRPEVKTFQSLRRVWDDKGINYSVPAFKLPEGFQGLCSGAKDILSVTSRAYLRKRGFGKSVWRKHNLGVAAGQGWRVIIPIEDDYWQGRGLFNWISPKYINPTVESRHCIFNSGALKRYDEVVVCEGAFSAMSVGDNAIALIRKKAITEQVTRLVESNVSRFILTIEPDAFRSVDYLANILRKRGKEVVLWCYDNGDPNSVKIPDKVIEYDMRSRVAMLLSVA